MYTYCKLYVSAASSPSASSLMDCRYGAIERASSQQQVLTNILGLQLSICILLGVYSVFCIPNVERLRLTGRNEAGP